MIKAFFSSVASRNENDYLTLRRLNYLFITVYHLLSLSPHLWPLDFSQWLYKFLFHLKASEHLFSSWVDLSIFFFTRLSTGYFHASFSPIIFLTSVLAYTKNSSKEFQHWWLNSVQYYLVEKEWLIGLKTYPYNWGKRGWISGRVYYYEAEQFKNTVILITCINSQTTIGWWRVNFTGKSFFIFCKE